MTAKARRPRLHWTDARLRGLEACFRQAGYVARRSNGTDVHFGCCYWQTADWLVTRGLARLEHHPAGDFVRLTQRGIEIARGSFSTARR